MRSKGDERLKGSAVQIFAQEGFQQAEEVFSGRRRGAVAGSDDIIGGHPDAITHDILGAVPLNVTRQCRRRPGPSPEPRWTGPIDLISLIWRRPDVGP